MANFSQSYNTEENMSILYFALDNVSEAAYLTDDKGNFLYINTEACFKLGYARNELLKMNVLSIDSNFDKEKWSVHWNALKKEKSLIFESTHKTKEGKIIPVEINANFFLFNKKMFNLGLVRDITERKNKEQKHQTFLNYLSIMDRINKVIQSSNDLERVINDVLDTVISIFTSDRAFLLYPLDIEADSWSLPKIRYREDFPVRIPENLKLTMLTETKKAFKVILDSKSPISFGPGTEYPTPPRAVNEFKVISMLAMPVFPKTGKPWMFGIQQCSYQRIWSPEEKEIFEQIGMRVSDALSILLSYRNLQQSEKKFRQIIETSNEGIMILDVEGRIAFANKHMSEMLGYSEKEIIGHLKSEFVFEKEINDHYLRLEHRRLNLAEDYERKFLRKDGKILWTLASATPLLSDSGEFTGSFAMFSDITERKEFELALQESEWRYHEIFDNVLDSLYLIEVTDDGHFRNLELNPAFEKSTGLSRKDLLGKILEETVSPENAEIANAKYRHCIEAGYPIEEEVVFNLPIGQRYFYSTLIPARDANGKIKRIIGISRDITSQKEAELEIKKLNRLYKMLASCNETLVHEKNENELLNKICQIIVDEGKYIMTWVGYAVNDEELSVRPVAYAGKEDGYLTNIKISWADNIYGRGPTGRTIRTGKISTSKFHSDSDFKVWKGQADARHYESSSAFPLTIENKTFGALNIYSEFQDTFDESELTLLQELANDLAFGIFSIRTKNEREKALLLLNEAQRIAHIGNWEYNIKDNFFSWSDEIYRIFEIKPEEFNGTYADFLNLIHPDDKLLVNSTYMNSIKTHSLYSLDHRLLLPNNKVKFVHAQCENYYDQEGVAYRSLGIIQDISDAKLAEKERIEHLMFVESIDKINRVIQGSEDLNQMMMNVLDAVLSIFNCDRSYLLYPCDPEAKFWTTPMERTKPEYPGVYELDLEIKTDPDVAQTFNILLNSNKPVKFGPNSPYPLPVEVSDKFGFKSFIAMVLYPKIGKPWQFGIHQCSYAREWSSQEEKLLEEIGRRLEDSLSSLLIHQNLEISEERYRMVFENSPVSLWEEDFSEVKSLLDDLKKNNIRDIDDYLSNNPELIHQCIKLVKILNVNRAALELHGTISKEILLSGLTVNSTPESLETFKQELTCIWNNKTQITRDSVIKTLSGEFKNVTMFFSVCVGAEETYSKVIVSVTDITKKMKIEAELRQSESRYRLLYNNTPVMLHSINNEGKLISVSDYWLDTMGYMREEVLGHDLTEFLTENSAEFLSKIVLPDFLEKGYCYNVEYQFVKKSGEVLDTILSAISEQSDEGQVLRSMAVITDITDRKKMELALRESEEKYRTLIQKIQAAVVVHAPNTKILTTNSLAEDLLGLTKEQLLGKMSIDPVWHFSHEDGKYVSIDEHPVNLVISSQKRVRNYVLKVHRPTLQTDVWVLVNADPVFNKEGILIQVIVTFIDITERKKAEMDLEEERKLFIGGPNVAFKWKAMEGWPIEYVSPNIAKQFGYSPEYLVRSNIKYANLIHPDDLKYIMNEIANYNQRQLPYFELEYRIMRADGEYRWVYNFITIVRDSFGAITYYQGHVTDITEERRSKDEIQKLNQNLEKRVKERTVQLESLNKELEAFSYSVSHDLRAPLFRIDGYIELLKEKIGDSPDKEVKVFLEHITKSSKDMSQLIDDILSFSRLGYQEIHTSTIDMNSLVRDVILEFKPEIKERIIQWNISNLPSIDGDKTLIHQVLTNLFSNALKFTTKKDKAIIGIGTIFSKKEYIFFIKDNGAGFDMKNASKLFSAFQRLHSKDEFEGTGIGLANVRRIINRHGGRCWAEGKVSEGAIFYFSLPKD